MCAATACSAAYLAVLDPQEESINSFLKTLENRSSSTELNTPLLQQYTAVVKGCPDPISPNSRGTWGAVMITALQCTPLNWRTAL